MSDEAFGGADERVKADAKAAFVDDLVGVFVVDPVLDGARAGFVEVGGVELDYVREGDLECVSCI